MLNGGCEGSVNVVPETVVVELPFVTVMKRPCFVHSHLWGEWWERIRLIDLWEVLYRGNFQHPTSLNPVKDKSK